MRKMVELEIVTTSDPDRDESVLARAVLAGYVAHAAIHDGRLCLVLRPLHRAECAWRIDCGSTHPRRPV